MNADAKFANCVSPNGGYSDLLSATVTASGPTTSASGANPCSLLFTVTGTGTITW